MKALSILLGTLVATLVITEVAAAAVSCRIETGYGTAIGKGETKSEALESARLDCGTKMIDDYIARRGQIPPEVIDDLALACVNLNCQK